MYNNLFTIGSFTIHGYGLMIGLGIIAAITLAEHQAKKYGLKKDSIIDVSLIGIIGGFIGAKLLYCIVEWKAFIQNPLALLGSDGFVVYGGIVLALVFAAIYCHIKKLRFYDYFNLCVPSIALGQAFGRIGCFLAGCCYGAETSAWYGVTFPQGSLAPSGVKLIPTQLISSAGDFLICITLLVFYAKSKHREDTGAMYLMLYGIGRFIIEFFRADYRGTIGFMSTSQFISIFFLIAAAILIVYNRKKYQKTAN